MGTKTSEWMNKCVRSELRSVSTLEEKSLTTYLHMFPQQLHQGLFFEETCKELSSLGGKVHGIAADVSSKEGREVGWTESGSVGPGWVRDEYGI